MQQIEVIIHNDVGLHARPAGQFVKTAKPFKSTIHVIYNGQTVNAKSLVRLLTLAIPRDATITVQADGEDEQEALQALSDLIARNFVE